MFYAKTLQKCLKNIFANVLYVEPMLKIGGGYV